jgi:hypothetical protein
MEEIKNVCGVITSIEEITIREMKRCEELLSGDTDNINNNVEVLSLLTNLSIEEIEDLQMSELNEIIELIAKQEFTSEGISFKNRFEIDGITYMNKSTEGNINFTVKEIFTLKEHYKCNKINSMSDVAAILFREMDTDGNISRDLSYEAVDKRKELFIDMTIDIILPYITEIKNHI